MQHSGSPTRNCRGRNYTKHLSSSYGNVRNSCGSCPHNEVYEKWLGKVVLIVKTSKWEQRCHITERHNLSLPHASVFITLILMLSIFNYNIPGLEPNLTTCWLCHYYAVLSLYYCHYYAVLSLYYCHYYAVLSLYYCHYYAVLSLLLIYTLYIIVVLA